MKKKLLKLKNEKLRQIKRLKKVKKNLVSQNKKWSLFITNKHLTKNKQTKKKGAKKQVSKRLKKNQKAQKKEPEIIFQPGQTKLPPSELSGARIFYVSLRKQNPKSKMAEAYVVKHGLIPRKEAELIYKKAMLLKEKNKRKQKVQRKAFKRHKLGNPRNQRTLKRKAQKQRSYRRKSKSKRRIARKNRVRRSSDSFDRITESFASFPADWFPICC